MAERPPPRPVQRRLRTRSNAGAETTHAYAQRLRLLSRGELAFYGVLRRAVPRRFGISLKTRLADLLHVRTELEWSADHLAVTSKHLDFVLYDLETTSVALVVELDDRSHRLRIRETRDDFVDSALKAAGVTVLHVAAAARYSLRELRLALYRHLPPPPLISRSRR